MVFHAREAINDYIVTNLKIIHVAYFISCTASLLSIGALATQRYITVTSPNRRRFSAARLILTSFAIWVLSVTISCFYFLTTFYTFLFIFVNTTVLSTFGFIVFAYFRIYQNIHAHLTRFRTSQRDRNVEQSFKFQKKVTRNFLLVLFFFVCCNFSSFIMVYVINFCDACSCDAIHWLRDFQFLVALVNCAANQFLYAWRMPAFTRLFKLRMPCRVRHRGRVRSHQFSTAQLKSPGEEPVNNENDNTVRESLP